MSLGRLPGLDLESERGERRCSVGDAVVADVVASSESVRRRTRSPARHLGSAPRRIVGIQAQMLGSERNPRPCGLLINMLYAVATTGLVVVETAVDGSGM